MSEQNVTGGCQCGAVRFSIRKLGKASICHCRMCQKAFGNLFAPLVEVAPDDITWTRGARSIFHSSNTNWRGFCKTCGTPLSYEFDGGVEIAIGALDTPDVAAPEVQVNARYARECFAGLNTLPEKPEDLRSADEEWNATVVSHQHPDHET
ncbi:MAG: GFA family protein [Pseudomonadota bacterium]